MKYIGIRGHRGAGKKSVAYLLGHVLDYITTNKQDPAPDIFVNWCKEIRDDITMFDKAELQHVIFEGFGDGPKMLVSMLTGIPLKDMNISVIKDNTWINLKDFSKTDDEPERTWGAEEYFMNRHWSGAPGSIDEDTYMSLREFILYFGIYVMQNAFGQNVWLKSLQVNNEYYNGLFDDTYTGYKIYYDIKARSEITYIHNKGGKVIRIIHPGHKKPGGMDLLKGDTRKDYEIRITRLEDLYDEILSIANEIIQL